MATRPDSGDVNAACLALHLGEAVFAISGALRLGDRCPSGPSGITALAASPHSYPFRRVS